MIKNVYDIAVVVSNAKRARKWYTEKLGFKVVEDMGHWVTVAPKSAKANTALHLCQGGKLEKGNTGIGFAVDNLDKTYKQFSRAGVKFTQEPVNKGWGAYAMFKDPDGNVFWLFE